MKNSKSAALQIFLVVTVLLSIQFDSTASTTQTAPSQPRYEVTVEKGVRTKMRDGVVLVADIFRPKAEGKFPVLLERTPYNRKDDSAEAQELAAHGYLVVLQDTRGRYDSGGEFYPFRDESQDGYDTVEWAALLDQSDGKVGMFGGSYVGATQMLAAMARPPHLVAISPYLTSSEYYDSWTYQSGVLMQWFTSSWTSILATDTLRKQVDGSMRPKDWITSLPVENYPILSVPQPSRLAPYFHDWIQHERNDTYWQRWRVSDHYSEINVKGLHAAGWHDIFSRDRSRTIQGFIPKQRRRMCVQVSAWSLGHGPTRQCRRKER